MKKIFLTILLAIFQISIFAQDSSIKIFDTKENTVMKVRIAKYKGKKFIAASDYDGKLLVMDFKGNVIWCKETGNGTMNHDIWCADITGDGIDEIVAANGNGSVYCFSIRGKQLWKFTPYRGPHVPPMYSVCVVKDKDKKSYVVAGNLNLITYYIDKKGDLVKELKNKTFSTIKAWGDPKSRPPEGSYANFLRPLPLPDGSDLLVMHAGMNHMQHGGAIYLFEPLSDHRYTTFKSTGLGGELADLRITDANNDGKYEILYGSSALFDAKFARIVFDDTTYTKGRIDNSSLERRFVGEAAYRVNQLVAYYSKDSTNGYALFSADQLFTFDNINDDQSFKKNEFVKKYTGKYAYNDIWTDKSGIMLLASNQDGGSCIYVINTSAYDWADAYKAIEPEGKIAQIKKNVEIVKNLIKDYKKPDYQRKPVQVVGFEGSGLMSSLNLNHKSVSLYNSPWSRGQVQEPSWRDELYKDNIYYKKRDSRERYVKDADATALYFEKSFTPDADGISTWGGHGNDPLYYQLSVLERIADYGYKNGKKKTIYVWPEMNHHSEDFKFLLDHHIYPLAEHLKKVKGKIALRAKDVFFQGPINSPTWERVASGEYSDVFIATMEETTDKTQDLSLASRMGMTAAGSFDGWGVRCSRDDPSFDRSRQFSTQKYYSHFLLKSLYSLAYGATYMHNAFKEPMELYLQLLSCEALYVPKTNEIVSFSPVHLSMHNPSSVFINEAENNKWNTYYNKEREDNNPMVFSHMNGSWLGGALTPWDFSTYAAGVVDRRQNAIPPYPNGMVLITPVQSNKIITKKLPRGKLVDKLHPMYKNILKEYVTDGVDYISLDGKERFKADQYYKKIKEDIEEGAKKLPLVVKGTKGNHVGWIVAEMAPTKLRLTLVDSGWLNPSNKTAKITFNASTPVKMIDALTKEPIDISNPKDITINVPCGLFKFIDIDIQKPLVN